MTADGKRRSKAGIVMKRGADDPFSSSIDQSTEL
jgi:hypothetical protein